MLDEQSKDTLDVLAASTGIFSLAAWLPPTASLFTIVWLGIRIYESETVQDLLGKKSSKEKSRGKVTKTRSKNTDKH